jgi:hypothetical protein
MGDFLLSVEEMALALSIVGQPQAAHDLMAAQLGDMEQEEARVRLLTAGHALMARGWLAMDEQGTVHLAEPVARVARVLSRAEFTIRYSLFDQQLDLSLAYHFGEGGIFSHNLEQGVVHHIVEVQGVDAVLKGGLEFLNVAEARPFACSPATFSEDLLNEIKNEEDVSAIAHRLQEAGVADETRVLLAEDMGTAHHRGSIMRVEYDEGNNPISDRGLLVLRGAERLWFLRPRPEEGGIMVTAMPGTEDVFRREVTALI